MGNRSIGIIYGIVCTLSFLSAVAVMMRGLFNGMSTPPLFSIPGNPLLIDIALLLQFPVLHSSLLGKRWRKALLYLAPKRFGYDLASTVFVIIASFQLMLCFLLWQPVGSSAITFSGPLWGISCAGFAFSWLFLVKAMHDSNLGIQAGYSGWLAVFKNQKVDYPPFSDRGVFKLCRQPIYLAFVLTLWTGPVWTLDHFIIAVIWSSYCYLAPIRKEKRYLERYGEAYALYQTRTSYFFPIKADFFGSAWGKVSRISPWRL